MLPTKQETSTLLSPDLLNENQELCLSRLFEHDSTLVVAEMGFGKTVVTLTAIKELIEEGVVGRVLVIAPLKVCKTVWKQEAARWSHLNDLNIALAVGTPSERVNAIDSNAEIVLMNYDNLSWFCDFYNNSHGFNGIVFDEISKLKNSSGTGFKKLRHRLKSFVWRAGLSGTPVSEDFEGLYAITMMLDSGARLGTRKDLFMIKYFFVHMNQESYNIYIHNKSRLTKIHITRSR
jgi:superfamily II DNA or RNA helicase